MKKKNNTLFYVLLSILLFYRPHLMASDSESKYPYQLSICTVFRDDARFLKEWIEFHLLVGVEHFYLFNHLSQDNYLSVLKPYMDKGIVELFDWPLEILIPTQWDIIQSTAIQAGIHKAKSKTKWLAIIDTDEFIIPMQSDNLVEGLQEFEEFGGIQINWQCYGTSNIEQIPEDALITELLVMKAPYDHEKNINVKSIVRPQRVLFCNHVHYVHYQPGYFSVNEQGEEIPPKQWGIKNFSTNKFRINHYWTRDEEYFKKDKLDRIEKRQHPTLEMVLRHKEEMNTVFDDVMLRFVAQMKNRMFTQKNDEN